MSIEIKRQVRMGIDVGGTHTKAVAIDNATQKIIGKASVKTTHDDEYGVAAGVVQAFQKCMEQHGIAPEEVIFVAHSTTQATNALVEGDVAKVGIIGTSEGGIQGLLAKIQMKLGNIDLGNGRKIEIVNRYIPEGKFSHDSVEQAAKELRAEGAEVFVATQAFGVDDMAEEQNIASVTKDEMGVETTMASEITKLYGLTRRTRTAAINASILPKMLNTANQTEYSVRTAGVTVPLMIMRGDGGVMEITEMKKRPVLTMLSGPAASVMGSLVYLRASNGVYFEVGGTTVNIGVIKDGRPAIDYSIVGGHRTYITSLDVRVMGVAGGSMIRVSEKGVKDVGPRSAHIAGLEYAVFTPEEEIVDPKLEMFSPRPGDPSDYVCIRLASGKRITITNTCAANVLGLIDPQYFSYGNAAAALIGFCAEKMGVHYSIPENAEVISSIGVALAMVRDVVERTVPNPTADDIRAIKQEAIDKAVESGAAPDTVEVHIEIDAQTSKLTAIASGSTEVKAQDLMAECSEEEAHAIAAEDMKTTVDAIEVTAHSPNFRIFQPKDTGGARAVRIVDKKGFIKVQRADAKAAATRVTGYRGVVTQMWEELAVYKADAILRPDYYICAGARVMDFSGSTELDRVLMLMDVEMQAMDASMEILVVGARTMM